MIEMKYFPRIFHYLRPYLPLTFVSVGTILLGSLAMMLAPWPLKILVDHVLENQPLSPRLSWLLGWVADDRYQMMIVVVIAGLAITLLANGINVLQSYVNTKIEQQMVLDIRSDLFQHAHRQSLAFHDQRRTGQLIFAINNQGHSAVGSLMAIQPLAESILGLAGMLWVTYQIDRQIAILALIVVPFLYWSLGYYTNDVLPRLRRVRGMEGESLSMVHEAILMLRVIVAFGREEYEHRRFRQQGEEAVRERVKITVGETLFSLAVNGTTAAGSALVLGFGGYRALQGQLSIGDLLVITSYIASVYKPLETISYTVSALQENLVSVEMIFDLLDREPDIQDAPGAITVGRAQGHLVYEDVHFSYSGRTDTLEGISFEAKAGQVIAIVGPTGAGKSTLVSLIPRFYDPQQGRILLDGIDIRQINLKSLREQTSIVLQEPLLFSGTIADNIRYGRLDATMEDVIEAAKSANAHDFVMRLPKQYETQVGEQGVQLSGGERQRICVARAFLKDSALLILDEPTSSIDSKTEAVILEALERLMEGRTTFMIAHRLSTIRKADKILVIDQGQLVEQGSHDELLQHEGLYKQLVDAQSDRSKHSSQPSIAALATHVAA
jgi:ATP-binding cassette, subfamily B, bacterial